MDIKMEESDKQNYIKLLREFNFNCFPIPHYPNDEPEPKGADYRYKASKTIHNQPIKDDENYGYIPISGKGNAILDLDNKEEYRDFAEENIKNGFMVIETGKGWHIPIIGLSGNISKIELFNYNIQSTKIIEIQGPDHYVMGVGCTIFHKELDKEISYENKGTNKIWDAKGKDFHGLIDFICKNLHVEGKKRSSRSGNQYLPSVSPAAGFHIRKSDVV